MAIDPLKAAGAYAQIAQLAANRAAPTVQKAATEQPPDFGAMVTQAARAAATSVAEGERAAARVASGESALVDVVTAVSAAEASLEAAIAIRNRVIEAYQDILRMPI